VEAHDDALAVPAEGGCGHRWTLAWRPGDGASRVLPPDDECEDVA
jgi:hypothetical protein